MITLLARILLVIDMKERRNPRDNDGKVEKAKVGTIFKQLSQIIDGYQAGYVYSWKIA